MRKINIYKKDQIGLFENYIKQTFHNQIPYIQIVSNSTINKGVLLKPDNDIMKSFDLFVVRYGLMLTTVSFYAYISKDFKRMALVFHKFGNPNIVYGKFNYCMIVDTDSIMEDITKYYDTELENKLRSYFENFPNKDFFNPEEDTSEIYFINNFPFGVVANNFNSYIYKQFKCYIENTTNTYNPNGNTFVDICKKSILLPKTFVSYNKDCNFVLTIFDNRMYIFPKHDFIEENRENFIEKNRENARSIYKILSI